MKGLRELAEGIPTLLIGGVFSYVIGLIPALFAALLVVMCSTFVLKVLTCLVPALICWCLARAKRVDGNESGNEAVGS